MSTTFARRRTAALLSVVALAAGAVPALAASKNGITPKAPKKNATVNVGSEPTFKGTFSGPGKIFVQVSKSPKRDANGLIGSDGLIQQAKKKGSTFKAKAKFFDFAGYWLNTPGTYYWQAYRIACEGDTSDCSQEGPTVKFKVK